MPSIDVVGHQRFGGPNCLRLHPKLYDFYLHLRENIKISTFLIW